MDSVRGQYADRDGLEAGPDDDHIGHEVPPMAIGHAERRLQVRAYNFWAAMLGDRQFPPVSALDGKQPDFAAFTALLDISQGGDDPAIDRIGAALAEECGAADAIRKLSDAPDLSLLSRIADHYRQVLASQAPVSFDAEFVNWRDATILYRGIMLPFSGDDTAIDHVLCVINWKEALDANVAGALEREIVEHLEPLRQLRLERDDRPAEEKAMPARDDALFERLRTLPGVSLSDIRLAGEDFALLLARQQPDGEMVVLGKVPQDPVLVERAARRVLGFGAG